MRKIAPIEFFDWSQIPIIDILELGSDTAIIEDETRGLPDTTGRQRSGVGSGQTIE